MSTNVTMSYGDYSFSPRPLISFDKQFIKTDAGSGLGTLYSIQLEGFILQTGTSFSVDNTFTELYELKDALDADGKRFQVTCDGTPFIDCRPRVTSFNTDDSFGDNYTRSASYQISFEVESLSGVDETINGYDPPAYIKSFGENWSVNFDEDIGYDNGNSDQTPIIINVNHTMNAQGQAIYDGGTNEAGTLRKEAWEEARDYLLDKTGFDNNILEMSGLLNFDVNNYTIINSNRSVDVDKSAGTVNLVENFVAIETGAAIHGLARESYDVNVTKTIDDALTRVSVNGNIEGLDDYSYGSSPGDFTVTTRKFDNASGYWNNVQNKIYYRANNIFQNLASGNFAALTLNTIPVSTTFGTNQSNGTISYTFEFNDRPSNCITNALSENITINDTLPGDLIAQLTVLGRANGPLLQSIGTKSPALQRNLSIEAVVAPSTGCTAGSLLGARPTGDVYTIISAIEADLTASYSQVFRTSDSSSWNPKNGRFSQNVTWTYSDC